MLYLDGGSLVYTSVSESNSLQKLIHSSLGIHSLLKRHPLKHNIIDRDKILVPPKWDSWGKIRVLDKSFSVEQVSKGWANDLQAPAHTSEPTERNGGGALDAAGGSNADNEDADRRLSSAVYLYEQLVPSTRRDLLATGDVRDGEPQGSSAGDSSKLEVETVDMQEFLAGQVEVLERLRQEHERDAPADRKVTRMVDPFMPNFSRDYKEGGTVEEVGVNDLDQGLVREHIGPVQFNVGGIQVDADDMLKRIAVRRFSLTSVSNRVRFRTNFSYISLN